MGGVGSYGRCGELWEAWGNCVGGVGELWETWGTGMVAQGMGGVAGTRTLTRSFHVCPAPDEKNVLPNHVTTRVAGTDERDSSHFPKCRPCGQRGWDSAVRFLGGGKRVRAVPSLEGSGSVLRSFRRQVWGDPLP